MGVRRRCVALKRLRQVREATGGRWNRCRYWALEGYSSSDSSDSSGGEVSQGAGLQQLQRHGRQHPTGEPSKGWLAQRRAAHGDRAGRHRVPGYGKSEANPLVFGLLRSATVDALRCCLACWPGDAAGATAVARTLHS